MLCTSDMYTLINYVGFINYLFYGVTVAGQIVLRIKQPNMHRPIKVCFMCSCIILAFSFFFYCIFCTLCTKLYKQRQQKNTHTIIHLSVISLLVNFSMWLFSLQFVCVSSFFVSLFNDSPVLWAQIILRSHENSRNSNRKAHFILKFTIDGKKHRKWRMQKVILQTKQKTDQINLLGRSVNIKNVFFLASKSFLSQIYRLSLWEELSQWFVWHGGQIKHVNKQNWSQ